MVQHDPGLHSTEEQALHSRTLPSAPAGQDAVELQGRHEISI